MIRRRRAADAPGGARSELWILAELARRLGSSVSFPTDPAVVFDELARASAGGVADYAGLSHARLDADEADGGPACTGRCRPRPPGHPRMFLDRFATPDGRARMVAVDHTGPSDDVRPDAPLYLVTGRVLQHYQSGAQTRRVPELDRLVPEPFVEVHPVLGTRLGVDDGDRARLTTARGAIEAVVRWTDRVRPDTVFMPFHWGGEGSVNRVTTDATDPVSGMPEFKVCAVDVRRAPRAPGGRGMTRVVVVGHGMVGSRFAGDLAARCGSSGASADVEVTVLGAEEHEPYNRVLLSEVVAGRADLAAIALPATDDPRVTVRRGTEALAIDRVARRVVTGEGAYPYDVVVLATGAAARPGRARSHRPARRPAPRRARPAHARRRARDRRGSLDARHAVVVGAGVLGLEVACGLARRGVAVSLVHGGASVMDRQLDRAAGGVVARGLAGLGVRTWTRARTERVVVDGGTVRGVTLRVADGGPRDLAADCSGAPAGASDGVRRVDLDADLVVLACGTVPEAGLARAAGLTVDRGSSSAPTSPARTTRACSRSATAPSLPRAAPG